MNGEQEDYCRRKGELVFRSDEIIDLKVLEEVLGLVDEGMGVGGEENVEANRNVISASTVVTFELV